MINWQFIWHRILIGLHLIKAEQTVSEKLATIPNGITAFGLLSIFLYQANYLYEYFTGDIGYFHNNMLALLVIAIISDILDGFFARALGSCSRFGEFIDPARDRYLALVIILQMMIESQNGFVIMMACLIILIEAVTALQNWKYSTSVHGMGKFRMGIHMFCSLVFVFQIYNLPLPVPVDITISIEMLITIMFLASLMSSFKYMQLVFKKNKIT